MARADKNAEFTRGAFVLIDESDRKGRPSAGVIIGDHWGAARDFLVRRWLGSRLSIWPIPVKRDEVIGHLSESDSRRGAIREALVEEHLTNRTKGMWG